MPSVPEGIVKHHRGIRGGGETKKKKRRSTMHMMNHTPLEMTNDRRETQLQPKIRVITLYPGHIYTSDNTLMIPGTWYHTVGQHSKLPRQTNGGHSEQAPPNQGGLPR